MAQRPLLCQRLLIFEDFTITLTHTHTHTHTTLGRTPLDEWSARRRDPFLTTHTRQDIHAPGGTRTRHPSKRVAADRCLKSPDHWDQRSRFLQRLIMLLAILAVTTKTYLTHFPLPSPPNAHNFQRTTDIVKGYPNSPACTYDRSWLKMNKNVSTSGKIRTLVLQSLCTSQISTGLVWIWP
jgi:hypothetical protein